MNSRHLTTKQAEVLDAKLRPMLGYLNRLRKRMEQQGFPIDDQLYRLTAGASNAMHNLSVHVHQLSCGLRDDFLGQPVRRRTLLFGPKCELARGRGERRCENADARRTDDVRAASMQLV